MTFADQRHTFDPERLGREEGDGSWARCAAGVLVALLLVAGSGPPVAAQSSTHRVGPDPRPVLDWDRRGSGTAVVTVASSASPWMRGASGSSTRGGHTPHAYASGMKANVDGGRSEQSVSQQTASAPPEAPALLTGWWVLALIVAVGGATAGVVYWVRARELRETLDRRTDELTAEKEEAKRAQEEATQRAERLEEMSEAKAQMLKELSHTFRTPLTLTLGPIDNLLEGKHGPLNDEAQVQLRLAQRNGTRLLWLVNQLLDLADLETGDMVLVATKGNFVQFVAKGMWSFEGLAERRDIRLGLEASLQDSEVWFDESKMERILGNLLTGAFRSAKEGGAIRVRVRPVDEEESSEQVELVVEDTGTGFVSEQENGHRKYARQGNNLWDTGDLSTSVGLHLVEELVDLHDGHVCVEGQMGEHIRFVVRLPRCPDGADEIPAGAGGDGMPKGLKGDNPGALTLTRKALALEMKNGDDISTPVVHGDEARPDESDRTTILVIDDNSVVRTLVRSHLEPKYRVEEAPEGAAGYNLASSLLPDLVIADVMMPEMDGFELCRKIKEDPDIDHVPVIFLTARADLEDKIEGLDLGADVYLTKPFEPEELIAHVENLIATRRSLRESLRDGRAHRGVSGDGPAPGITAEGVQSAAESLPPTAGGKPLKERIEEIIADKLTDPDFGVSDLADSTALSSSQLRRRMKEVYDRTPVQLIRRRRLEAGAQLLREREDATIGEVAYAVGFNSQSYFSRSFRDEFGTSPSRYRNQHDGIEA